MEAARLTSGGWAWHGIQRAGTASPAEGLQLGDADAEAAGELIFHRSAAEGIKTRKRKRAVPDRDPVILSAPRVRLAVREGLDASAGQASLGPLPVEKKRGSEEQSETSAGPDRQGSPPFEAKEHLDGPPPLVAPASVRWTRYGHDLEPASACGEPVVWASSREILAETVPLLPSKLPLRISTSGLARSLLVDASSLVKAGWHVSKKKVEVALRITVKKKRTSSSRNPAPTPSDLDAWLASLQLSRTNGTRLYLLADEAGAAMLGCSLPASAQCALIGGFDVRQACVVDGESPSGPSAPDTEKTAPALDVVLRWMPSNLCPSPWFLTRKASAPFQKRKTVRMDPPLYHSPPIGTPSMGSPVAALFRGVACPSCRRAIIRTEWAGWRCPCSKSTLLKALPLVVRRDVPFKKMRILYDGPRMDNGRAMMDLQAGIERSIVIWSDVVKTATYRIPLGGPDENASTAIHHLLSSGPASSEADKLLAQLLQPDMPYSRPVLLDLAKPGKKAGSKPPKVSHRYANYYAASIRAERSAPASNLLSAPALPASEAPEPILDAVEHTEGLVARFVEGSGVEAFNEVTAMASVKAKLIVTGATGDATTSRHRALLHLGVDASVTISRVPHTRTDAAAVTLILTHGDVLFLPDCRSLAQAFEIRVAHKALSVTLILRHVQ